MPMFRVELERRVFMAGERPINPFLVQISHMGPDCRVTMSVRTWEFEAKLERAVRYWYRKAVKDNLPQVQGYSLRSIVELPPKDAT